MGEPTPRFRHIRYWGRDLIPFVRLERDLELGHELYLSWLGHALIFHWGGP